MSNTRMRSLAASGWANSRPISIRRGKKRFFDKFIGEETTSSSTSRGRFSRANWDWGSSSSGRRPSRRVSNLSNGSFGDGRNEEGNICYACEGLTGGELPEYHSINCEKNQDSLNNSKVQRTSSTGPRCSSETGRSTNLKWIFGESLSPLSPIIKTCNRVFLLSRVLGAFIDPLFLYVLAVDRQLSCLFVQKRFAVMVTALRTAIDILFLSHIWMQLKLAYVSKQSRKLGPGRGQLVMDARKIARHYLTSWGFIIDLLVIIPIPQLVFWVIVPLLIERGETTKVMTVVLVAFSCQLLFKVLHLLLIVRRMRLVTGYVFGTAFWGFFFNLLAYYIAAHVAGACWYLLAIQRVEHCLQLQCNATENCKASYLGCPNPINYGAQPGVEAGRMAWGQDANITSTCLTIDAGGKGGFNWGIYAWAIPLVRDTSWLEKILYPMFWGVMTLSSFGNALAPSNHMLEVVFALTVVTCGLLLFTMLIGSIQVFLHSITSKKEMMQLQMRDLEWWMRRRQLPHSLKQRVRQYERQRWAAMRGLDESSMVSLLPEGLRRDIKKQLSEELIRQVPLFHQMNEILLSNICDRLKHLFFIKDETIIKEGELVQRMLFIARGQIMSLDRINKNIYKAILGPGNFSGEELVHWVLNQPTTENLPTSTTTLTSLDYVEAFEFAAGDLKFIVEHYKRSFEAEKLRHAARFYSFHWRAWAASKIQLAWRRSKARKGGKAGSLLLAQLSVPQASSSSASALSVDDTDKLRMYTAMFTPKPHDTKPSPFL